jgi:preprotein translocase subunit SecY
MRQFEENREGILGFLDMMTGGALSSAGIFALGVGPYINSSIVMQLLVVIFPALEKMQKEGEDGRKRITQYTRIGTIFFAVVQAIGLIAMLSRREIFVGDWFLRSVAILTMTTGAMVVMWLGEVMSDHGIGNGTSMLIYAGIVTRLPATVTMTIDQLRTGANVLVVLLALVIILAVVAGCVYLQEGQRRLPVQYAKRMVGNKMYGGQSTFIPLKVNTAGVIPIIFATSVLMFPALIAGYFEGEWAARIGRAFGNADHPVHIALVVLLIVFFSYFYTAVVFNPTDLSNNMKKYGGFILGIRPGKPTTEYIERVMNRITLGGAIALAVIQLVPSLISSGLNVQSLGFGGTAVIIVVGVALDTIHQVEGQMLMRHYDGILKRRGKSGGLL